MRALRFIMALTLIIALGCNEQQAPLENSMDNTADNAVFQKPPAQSGPWVVRGGADEWWMWFWDGEQGLLSVHFFANENVWCGDPADEYTPIAWQDINNPSDYDLVVTHATSKDHFVWVYDWPEPLEITCENLANATLLAKGTGSLIGPDNDYFAGYPHDRMRANAWGWFGQGQLEDMVNGGSVHYNLVYKNTWKQDMGSFVSILKINLKYTGN